MEKPERLHDMNAEEFSKVIKKLVTQLAGAGIPVQSAKTLIEGAYRCHATMAMVNIAGDKEQQMNLFLEYFDDSIRETLGGFFAMTETVGDLDQAEVIDIGLSTLLTHASFGCLMVTKSPEDARKMYDQICATAFEAACDRERDEEEDADVTVH